jgi:hypothetical protein
MAVDRRQRRADRRRLVGVVGRDAGRPAPGATAQLLAQALRPVRAEELVEARVVGRPELRDDDRGGFSPS